MQQSNQIKIDYTPQPKQVELHKSAANEILYGGAAGPGKICCDTSKILTPWGWKEGKDIDVGSIILNPDGSRQRIIAVSPRIEAPGYTVKTHDGGKTTVMAGHLWLSWRSGKRVKSVLNGMFGPTSAKVITTKTLKDWSDDAKQAANSAKRPNWPLIPVCKPLHYERVFNPSTIIDIDPYLLGLLLGDGHIGNGAVAITSNDVDHITDEIAGYDYHVGRKGDTDTFTFSFRGDSLVGLKSDLQKVGLYGKLSYEKFIPDQYLFGGIDDRLSVLQGLMDTDGTADSRGGWPSFCSTSKQLADDVRSIVFSLGGTATISSRYPTYTTMQGETATGRLAYNVYIKMPDIPGIFRLKRKSDIAGVCLPTPMYRRIVDVDIGPEVSGRCITVDNPNGLYITDDFIVTHNSMALRFEALIWCLRVPGIQVYLFRRTYPELEKNHILPALQQFPNDSRVLTYKKGDKRWEFTNGSMLHFCHCQYEQDVFQYQGAEIHLLLIDELTTFTEFQYDYLRGRVRCALPIEKNYRHKVPGIICATNPGGIGHEFCKRRWVDFLAPMELKRAEKKEGGMVRQYIPGLLQDNAILMQQDPNYIHRLDALPEPYRTAYKDGKWDIFLGQAFNFSKEHHVIQPIPVPDNAPIYMTFDWGFGAPFSIGWWWVDADGRLLRFAEWYGWNGEINKGLRLEDSRIAEGIVEREQKRGGVRPQVRLTGHDSFNKKPDYKGGGQGKSTSEVFAEYGLYLTKADPSRELKIRQFRERLKVVPGERPMMQVYSTCEQFIRTIPLIQTDPNNVEYVDDNSELHCFAGETPVCLPSGNVFIQDLVGTKGKVLTVGGAWTNYSNCRKTRNNVDMVEVIFQNGEKIKCTKDHKFLSKRKGWVEAKDLTNEACHISIPNKCGINNNLEDIICKLESLMTQRRNLMGLNIGREIPASIMEGVHGKAKTKDYIGMYGNILMGEFLKVIISTTQMMIETIIRLKTLNARQQVCTYPTMGSKLITQTGLQQDKKSLLSGMEAQKVLRGINLNMKNIVNLNFTKERFPKLAGFVAKLLSGLRFLNIVQKNANKGLGRTNKKSLVSVLFAEKNLKASDKLVHLLAQQGKHGTHERVTIVKPAGRADVYCLNAAYTHAFCVGSGIVVHNCFDDAAQIAMFRPLALKMPLTKISSHDQRLDALTKGKTTPFEDHAREQLRHSPLGQGDYDWGPMDSYEDGLYATV